MIGILRSLKVLTVLIIWRHWVGGSKVSLVAKNACTVVKISLVLQATLCAVRGCEEEPDIRMATRVRV